MKGNWKCDNCGHTWVETFRVVSSTTTKCPRCGDEDKIMVTSYDKGGE